MESLVKSIAVTGAEVGNIEMALVALLGAHHPYQNVLSGALADVGGRMLTATTYAAAGQDAAAREIALSQLRALESLRTLVPTLDPAPRCAQELADKLELICGLLELITGAEPTLT